MKQFLLISGVVLMVALAACHKNSTTPDNNNGTLKFTSLVANDTVIKINEITTLTATATGEGLTYTWTCDFGTFIGSGNTVQWTVCHADNFTINCMVTDKNSNSASKTIVIRTHV
jgi:hypothetical protein